MAKAERAAEAHAEGRTPVDQRQPTRLNGYRSSARSGVVPAVDEGEPTSPSAATSGTVKEPITSVFSQAAGADGVEILGVQPGVVTAKDSTGAGDSSQQISQARTQEPDGDKAAAGDGSGEGGMPTEHGEAGDGAPRNWKEATSFMRVHDGKQTDIPLGEQAVVARDLNNYFENKKETLRDTNPAALQEDDDWIFGRTHAELTLQDGSSIKIRIVGNRGIDTNVRVTHVVDGLDREDALYMWNAGIDAVIRMDKYRVYPEDFPETKEADLSHDGIQEMEAELHEANKVEREMLEEDRRNRKNLQPIGRAELEGLKKLINQAKVKTIDEVTMETYGTLKPDRLEVTLVDGAMLMDVVPGDYPDDPAGKPEIKDEVRESTESTEAGQVRLLPWSEFYASISESYTEAELTEAIRYAFDNAPVVETSFTGAELNTDKLSKGDLDIVTGDDTKEVTIAKHAKDFVYVRTAEELERALKIAYNLYLQTYLEEKPELTFKEILKLQENIDHAIKDTLEHEQQHEASAGVTDENSIYGVHFTKIDGELHIQAFNQVGKHTNKLQMAATLLHPDEPSIGDVATVKQKLGYRDIEDVAERIYVYNQTHENQIPFPRSVDQEAVRERMADRIPTVALNQAVDSVLADPAFAEILDHLGEISSDRMHAIEEWQKKRAAIAADLAYLQVFPPEETAQVTVALLSEDLADLTERSVRELVYGIMEDDEAYQLWSKVIVEVGKAADEKMKSNIANQLTFIHNFKNGIYQSQVDGLLEQFEHAGVDLRSFMPVETAALDERGAEQEASVADERRKLTFQYLDGDGTFKTMVDAGYVKNGEPALGFYVDPQEPGKVYRYAFMGNANSEDSIRSSQQSKATMVAQYERLQASGITVPDLNPKLVIEDQTGYLLMLTEVDVVQGQDLRDYLRTNALTPEVKTQIEALFKNQLKYVRDTIEGEHSYLFDTMVLEQYMIGNTAKDGETKLYMIDVAPDSQDAAAEAVFRQGLRQIVMSIQIVEWLTKTKFENSNELFLAEAEALYELLKERLPDEQSEERKYLDASYKLIIQEFNDSFFDERQSETDAAAHQQENENAGAEVAIDPASQETGEMNDIVAEVDEAMEVYRQSVEWSKFYASIPETYTDEQLETAIRNALELTPVTETSYDGNPDQTGLAHHSDLAYVNTDLFGNTRVLAKPHELFFRNADDLRRAIKIAYRLKGEVFDEETLNLVIEHEKQHIEGLATPPTEEEYGFGLELMKHSGESLFDNITASALIGRKLTKLEKAAVTAHPAILYFGELETGDILTLKDLGFKDISDLTKKLRLYNGLHRRQIPLPLSAEQTGDHDPEARQQFLGEIAQHPIEQIMQGVRPEMTDTLSQLRKRSAERMKEIDALRIQREELLGDIAYLDATQSEHQGFIIGTSQFGLHEKLRYVEYELVQVIAGGVGEINPRIGNLWETFVVELARTADKPLRDQLARQVLSDQNQSIFARRRVDRVLKKIAEVNTEKAEDEEVPPAMILEKFDQTDNEVWE